MDAPAENSTFPKRVQLDHLLLDRDFFRKPKILLFMSRFGPSATIWLTDLLGVLSGATNAEIETEVAYCTSVMFGVKNPEQVMEYLLQHKILISSRPGYISNIRVIKDQEACALKRDKWKTAKRQQRGQVEDKERTLLGQVSGHGSGPLNTEILNTEDLNIDLKKNGHPAPKLEIPPDDAELVFADAQLEDPEAENVKFSSVYVNTQRRPIKKYPALWLTPFELKDVFKIAQESGIPRNKLELLFKPVASWAISKKPPDRTNAFGALTGWGLENALKTLKASTDLQRSETYLNNAKS